MKKTQAFRLGRIWAVQDVSRYVYMAVDDEPPERSARLHGYMKGLASAGKALGEDSILTAERSPEAAYEAVMASSAMFCRERTGNFVYNDMMALGVLNALRELGVAVPDQAQVFGMDDIPLASWFTPRLSTMRSPRCARWSGTDAIF